MADLKTNYKDDVLDTSKNQKRKYKMIQNPDGTVSFEDVTVYTQEGDSFGGADINATNKFCNLLNQSLDKYITDDTIAMNKIDLELEGISESLNAIQLFTNGLENNHKIINGSSTIHKGEDKVYFKYNNNNLSIYNCLMVIPICIQIASNVQTYTVTTDIDSKYYALLKEPTAGDTIFNWVAIVAKNL